VINWKLLELRNLLTIGAIVLLTRFAFYAAFNALDGKDSSTSTQ
jgi:hypothetical protein